MLLGPANPRYGLYVSKDQLPYDWVGLDDVGELLDMTLKADGGKVMLHVGKDSDPIPEDTLDEHGRIVSALVTPARCYVVHLAEHDDRQLTRPLAMPASFVLTVVLGAE